MPTDPVEYRGAKIYLRHTKNGWYSDWGWLEKKTIRHPGGWSNTPQVALLKSKQAIDTNKNITAIQNKFLLGRA